MLSTAGLPTTATLKSVDNKIPDVRNLAKKKDYDAKISDIWSIYFTTSDYTNCTNNIPDATIKKLVIQSGSFGFIDNIDLDGKIKAISSKSRGKSLTRSINETGNI